MVSLTSNPQKGITSTVMWHSIAMLHQVNFFFKFYRSRFPTISNFFVAHFEVIRRPIRIGKKAVPVFTQETLGNFSYVWSHKGLAQNLLTNTPVPRCSVITVVCVLVPVCVCLRDLC